MNSQPNLDGTVVPHVKVGTPKFVEADQEIPYHVSDKVVVEGGMVASKRMNTLENLEQHAPDLAFELPDGKPVVRLGLILTLYFKRGYTNDTKKNVLACFRRFYEEYKSQLKRLIYGRHQKLTSTNFEKAHQAISKSGGNEEFSLFSGSAADEAEADEYSLSAMNSFEIHGENLRSYIKLVMPWSVFKEIDGLSSI